MCDFQEPEPLDRLSCKCSMPETDNRGRVLKLETCPICMKNVLDIVRGIEYSVNYEKGVSQLLVQKELFSFSRYDRFGLTQVMPHGQPYRK